MKQPQTIQELHNAVKNGTGAKDVFLKEAKRLYSGIIPNAATFDQTVKIFKNKGVLNENYVDLKPITEWEGRAKEPWEKQYASFLKEQEEDVKAETTKQSKYEEETRKHAYDNSDVKNLDNQIGQEVFKGIEFEACENPDKTLAELRSIVLKNLAKDKLYYVKNAMFGVKGLGYTEDAPGLKASKTDQMEKVKLNEGLFNRKKGPKVDGTYTVEYIKGTGKGHGKVFADQRTAQGFSDNVNDMAKDKITIVYPTGKRPESIQESKKPSIDQRLKDIHKAGDLVTLEAKIEAIDEEINSRNERINMIGENEDLKELVNPAKMKELQKEIKLLEKSKAQYQKLYEKMTGKKKAEVIDEPQEVEEETGEVDEIYDSGEDDMALNEIKVNDPTEYDLYDLEQDFSESGSVLFASEDETSIRFIVPIKEFEAVINGKRKYVIDEEGDIHLCDKDFAEQVIESDKMNHEDEDLDKDDSIFL